MISIFLGEKLNVEQPELYKESIAAIRYVSSDYFCQAQINRVLKTKFPSIDLHSCELNDNTFFYRLLQMLELKQKQKLIFDPVTCNPTCVTGVAPYLTRLDLSHNSLTILPKELQQISNLQWFNVSNNNLKSLPINMGLYRNLKYLDISNNDLKMLPSSFAELRNHKTNEIILSELLLNGNDIECPPKRILKQGIPFIIDFFADLLDGEDETCKKVSIICLGSAGSGRTSLLRSFVARTRGKSFLSRLASKSNVMEKKEEIIENPIDIISFQLKGSVTRSISDSGVAPIEIVKDLIQKRKQPLSKSKDISLIDIEKLWIKYVDSGVFYDFSKQGQAKAFKRYFIGSEFVDWWVENAQISRKEAVQLGNIFEQASLIRHPDKKQHFTDQKTANFIICGEESSEISIDYRAIDFSSKGNCIFF